MLHLSHYLAYFAVNGLLQPFQQSINWRYYGDAVVGGSRNMNMLNDKPNCYND